jgi:hypothetical protein
MGNKRITYVCRAGPRLVGAPGQANNLVPLQADIL